MQAAHQLWRYGASGRFRHLCNNPCKPRATVEDVLPATPLAVQPARTVDRLQATIAPSTQAVIAASTPAAAIPAGPPVRAGKVALNFRLDPELHQKLRAASYRTDVSIQMIVETAVRQYLDAMAL